MGYEEVIVWTTIILIQFPTQEQCELYHQAVNGNNGNCVPITHHIMKLEHDVPPIRPEIFSIGKNEWVQELGGR